jgi:hypothetical protein
MALSFSPYHGAHSIFLNQLIILNVMIQMSFAQTCSIKALDVPPPIIAELSRCISAAL